MDTNKFEFTLNHTDFYNSYINTIRRLYSDSFIKENNMLPDNEASLSKTMLVTMGKSYDSYSREDFKDIVDKTNERYDKIMSTTEISKDIKNKMLRNVTIFADIISSILKGVGLSDIADGFNCSSRKLIESDNTENEKEVDEHVNDNVSNTKSGIEELNNVLNKLSEQPLENIEKEESDMPNMNDELIDRVKEGTNNIFINFREAVAKNENTLYTIISEQKKTIDELKKKVEELENKATVVPTDPKEKIEFIKNLISSHEDKEGLKQILIGLIVNL